MKILVVRGQNLASLSQRFDIDLEHRALGQAGVFAIHGPTGAGKTTLLDAICVALYHQTPRLSGAAAASSVPDAAAGQSLAARDPRQLLRRGTADGWAEVEFRGIDGQRWRARWQVRRAHGRRDGKLQAAEASLIEVDSGQRIGRTLTEVRQAIEQRIGLGFAQFIRAVLLAQGEFAAFLRAPAADRAELLEALTGLERYSRLSIAAFERAAAGELALKLERARLDAIDWLSDAQRAELETRVNALEARQAVLAAALDGLRAQRAWWQQATALELAWQQAGDADAEARKVHAAAAPERLAWHQWQLGERAAPLLLRLDQATAARRIAMDECARRDQDLTAARRTLDQALAQQQHTAAQEQQARQAQADAAPQLAAARALDLQCAATAAAAAALDRPLAAAAAAIARQQQAVAALAEREHVRRSAVLALEQERAALAPLAVLLPQWPAIRLQLRDWQTQAAQVTSLDATLRAHGEAIATHETQHAALHAERDQRQRMLADLEQDWRRAEQALGAVDADGLGVAEAGWRARREHWREATAAWEQLQRASAEAAAAAAQATQLAQRELALATEAQRWQTELPLRAEFATEAQARLERARDAHDQRTARLRQQLIEGEPCPVCGSTAHPWATHAPPADDAALAELEAAAQAAQTVLAQVQHADIATAATRHALAAEQRTMAAELARREIDRQQAAVHWNAARQALPAADDETQRLARSAAQLEADAAQLAHWQAKLDAARSQRDSAASAWSQARDALPSIQLALERADDALRGLLAEQSAFAIRRETAAAQAAAAQSALVADPEIWSALECAPDTPPSLTRIAQLERALSRLTALDAERVRLQSEHLEDAKSLEGLQREAQERMLPEHAALAARRRELAGQLEALTARRRAVLAAPSVEAHATALQSALSLAAQAAQAAEQTWQQQQRAHDQALAQQTSALTRQQAATAAVDEAETALASWWQQQTEATTATAPPLEALRAWAAIPPAQRSANRARLDALDAALAVAVQRLADCSAALARHQTDPARPNAAATVVESELAELEQSLAADHQARGALHQQLAADTALRAQHAAGLAALAGAEQAHQVWAQLNELIGSRSGDKFRRLAQQHTLDLVLAYSNQQLAELAPRYRLARQDFELLVSDGDMGDEVRDTSSLSGGETFLVSLALALGLASLAAQRVPVQSLFIDEGFGSLDQDTLRVAIDALDRLQAQGRQVGIISHVAELTERIAVRIRVRRQGHGRSVVEVP